MNRSIRSQLRGKTLGLVLIGALAGLISPLSRAEPTTQSSSGTEEVQRPSRPRALRPLGGPRRFADAPAFSEADWTEAAEFIRVHSPRRYEVFELLPDDSPQKRAVRRFMLTRYLNLKDFKASDPDSYEARLKRMETEDEVFGLAADLRRAEGPRREALRTELRTHVAELIDEGIAERKAKIARLEKLLIEERERLASYEKGRDTLVEQRIEQEITSPGGSVVPGPPQGTNDVDPSPADEQAVVRAPSRGEP